ncbi:energy-coupling factor transporter transmembrane protein EcfT [Tumebacillus sp. ITR2]|uniref:Energy-coupling factor transporter transmembrane protein EcfT n=1 Tax=Tumebacillus amylolyticus TaxID=2801339 RepID=A0ABS1J7A1_9BACL|nr:energy-coupling factor transporter transmembrane component T [Tumebacillus amylolyticus]MBL0386138.1 energy-coupling factor transporter transmembrane protein EcfT [Tumebacillus amylolyticus]
MSRSADRHNLRGHAATLLFYPFLMLMVSVLTYHPLYLGTELLVLIFALALHGGVRTFGRTLKFSIPILVLILAINTLLNKNGATLLYKGPTVAILGQIRITWEALAYGLIMGLRMLVFFAIFALALNWLSADRALGLSAKVAKRSAVTVMMTTRLIPYLTEQSHQIGDVLRTRGVRFEEGNLLSRLAARRPLLNVLLISSLEGSWQVAESMEARGFGQGKRTSYSRERWSRIDLIIWLTFLAAIALVVWSWFTAWTWIEFYPRIQTVMADEGPWPTVFHAVALALLLALPPLLLKKRRRTSNGTS